MVLGLPKNFSSHFLGFCFLKNFELKKFVLEKNFLCFKGVDKFLKQVFFKWLNLNLLQNENGNKIKHDTCVMIGVLVLPQKDLKDEESEDPSVIPERYLIIITYVLLVSLLIYTLLLTPLTFKWLTSNFSLKLHPWIWH